MAAGLGGQRVSRNESMKVSAKGGAAGRSEITVWLSGLPFRMKYLRSACVDKLGGNSVGEEILPFKKRTALP